MKYLYFYDCPRTGGTSFKRWSRRCSTVKRLHYGEGKGWHHVPFRPRSEVKELAPKDIEKIWTFTFLRDPVEHAASLFAKIRQHKHGYREKLVGLTFEEWIHGIYAEDVASAPAPWGFSMVRFYDPHTEDLETAIKNIETMDFVCFTERLTLDVNLMLKEANSEALFDGPRLNVVRRIFKITERDREVIQKVRANDFKLVNHFRRKRGLLPYGQG